MIHPQNRLETLSPALFLLGCVALFSRDFGATLTTNRARLKAMLPIIILSVLAIVLCDHFWVAQAVASLICSAFIWLTFDKKQNNFPDRLANQVARILRCGLLVLTILPATLVELASRVPPVPTAPPRFTLA